LNSSTTEDCIAEIPAINPITAIVTTVTNSAETMNPLSSAINGRNQVRPQWWRNTLRSFMVSLPVL
jgi:hypothetical protein